MSEFELTKRIEELKSRLNENIDDLTRQEEAKIRTEVKECNDELQKLLTKGANACPDCDNLPIGLHQIKTYEVGCTHCYNHRSRGRTVEEAVFNWNKGLYLPPNTNRAPQIRVA